MLKLATASVLLLISGALAVGASSHSQLFTSGGSFDRVSRHVMEMV
jgi:hypothetical protein